MSNNDPKEIKQPKPTVGKGRKTNKDTAEAKATLKANKKKVYKQSKAKFQPAEKVGTPKPKPKSYWLERASANKKHSIKIEQKAQQELEKIYRRNIKNLEKQINEFYKQYPNPKAQLSVFETKQAKKALRDTVKKYPDDKYIKRLYKNTVPVYKLNRLEGLHADLQVKLTEITGVQAKSIESTAKSIGADGYKRLSSDFEVLGLKFATVDDDIIKQIVNTKWVNKKNWSERIWSDRNKLGKSVTRTLQDGFTKGISNQEMTRALRTKVATSYNNAFRLIRTEGANVVEQVTLKHYNANPYVEKYRYEAFLDSRTSAICTELDGQEFNLEDAETGVNYPPSHPSCRSTTTPIIDF